MAEYDERYEGNGDHAAAAAAAADYGAAPAGGSPPAGAKPSGFSDHADGRSAPPQVSLSPLICVRI
jgi:splicing factor U2AF 65 kDa subunit